MKVAGSTSSTQVPQENQSASCPCRCPVCNGLLISLPGSSRCSRCSFRICEGCEGTADRFYEHAD